MRSRSTSQAAPESPRRAEPRERIPPASAAAPLRTALGSALPLTAWRRPAWPPIAWPPLAWLQPASLPRPSAWLQPASLPIGWPPSTSQPLACLPMSKALRPAVLGLAVTRSFRTVGRCSDWLEPQRSRERCLVRASGPGAHRRRRDPATPRAEIPDAPERAVPGCLGKALALEGIPRPPIGAARSPAAEAGSSNRHQA